MTSLVPSWVLAELERQEAEDNRNLTNRAHALAGYPLGRPNVA